MKKKTNWQGKGSCIAANRSQGDRRERTATFENSRRRVTCIRPCLGLELTDTLRVSSPRDTAVRSSGCRYVPAPLEKRELRQSETSSRGGRPVLSRCLPPQW